MTTLDQLQESIDGANAAVDGLLGRNERMRACLTDMLRERHALAEWLTFDGRGYCWVTDPLCESARAALGLSLPKAEEGARFEI